MSDFIKQIKNKDQKSIELLYQRFGKNLYGYAVVKWNVSEDASWDLVYKTLYQVMDVIEKYTFDNESQFSGFVFRIFTNYLKNHFRDSERKSIKTTELNEHIVPNTVSENSDSKEPSVNLNCLEKELSKLEDWQRILLLLRAQDYSYENIAQYVEKPESQLKVYFMRLKQSVKSGVEDCLEKFKK